jgi:hypothetical protein
VYSPLVAAPVLQRDTSLTLDVRRFTDSWEWNADRKLGWKLYEGRHLKDQGLQTRKRRLSDVFLYL